MHWYARMRLCSAVLFVALTGGAAFAGSKVPLRVVRVMPDTHQALLFDKTQGTHVLVEQGKSIDGYLVEDIDEDEVTLVGDSGTEIVLAAPDYRHHHDDDKAEKIEKKPAAPQDPYASSPQDPYAETPIAVGEGGVRTTEAPSAAAAPTAVRVAEAPTAAPTTAPATVVATPPVPAAPPPATEAPSAAWTSSAPPPIVAADAPIALTRADVNASLANFSKLAGSIHGSFTADGARLDAIAPDSLFAKAGLHNGDVISAVDGQPLKSLDAAASLYARAAGVKTLTLSVIRAAKPLTLRVVIAQ